MYPNIDKLNNLIYSFIQQISAVYLLCAKQWGYNGIQDLFSSHKDLRDSIGRKTCQEENRQKLRSGNSKTSRGADFILGKSRAMKR